jgi:hypothetical protein
MIPITVSQVPFGGHPLVEATFPVLGLTPTNSPTSSTLDTNGTLLEEESRRRSRPTTVFLLLLASVAVVVLLRYGQNKYEQWSTTIRFKSQSSQEVEGEEDDLTEMDEWVGTKTASTPRYNASSVLDQPEKPYRDTPIGYLDKLPEGQKEAYDDDDDDSDAYRDRPSAPSSFSVASASAVVLSPSRRRPPRISWSEAPNAVQAIQAHQKALAAGPPRSAFPPQRVTLDDQAFHLAQGDLC